MILLDNNSYEYAPDQLGEKAWFKYEYTECPSYCNFSTSLLYVYVYAYLFMYCIYPPYLNNPSFIYTKHGCVGAGPRSRT